MTTDAFLLAYFAASERRASPRTVSLETRAEGGGTLEQAQHADARYTWALAVMGPVERALTPRQLAVLRGYYLRLTPAHVSIVARTWRGAQGVVSASPLRPGDTPLPAADLQSMCDWHALASAVGIVGRFAAGDARRMWSEARGVVDEALRARGIVGVVDAEVVG